MSEEDREMPPRNDDERMVSLLNDLADDLHQFMVYWARKNGVERALAQGSVAGMDKALELTVLMLAVLASEAGQLAHMVAAGIPEAEARTEEVFLQQFRQSRDELGDQRPARH